LGTRRKDPRLLQNGDETWDWQHTQSSAAAVSGDTT
jgi:hypothetical protein